VGKPELDHHSPNLLITGSGGANDVASGASEVLVVVPQSPFRFVLEVAYITAPGQRVRVLVATLGLFEKLDRDREFTLTGILEDGKSSADERVRAIKEKCQWELKIGSHLKILGPPTPDEPGLLRLFYPHKYFLTEPT
jgi:acyl CoA:acetate/3-ketoacid CoA transferase beta subunit